MKKIFIYILLALFSITAMGVVPAQDVVVYAQKDKREKKDPPGPPVVRDKGKKDEPKKDEPRKGKKQDEL